MNTSVGKTLMFDCFKARLQAADIYHNSKLLRKYFNLLHANVTDERHEKLLEKRADNHYR